ncbi:hypothetical protein [Variovorax sp. PBL-H6]|uniref:hypothetical protein n=1 Tax=Variovorax sp. PBL-H6 TaxID=434009 RepID=UPI0013A560C7|nr:hypothetical protein [Variovorax sp. PBL-H6]
MRFNNYLPPSSKNLTDKLDSKSDDISSEESSESQLSKAVPKKMLGNHRDLPKTLKNEGVKQARRMPAKTDNTSIKKPTPDNTGIKSKLSRLIYKPDRAAGNQIKLAKEDAKALKEITKVVAPLFLIQISPSEKIALEEECSAARASNSPVSIQKLTWDFYVRTAIRQQRPAAHNTGIPPMLIANFESIREEYMAMKPHDINSAAKKNDDGCQNLDRVVDDGRNFRPCVETSCPSQRTIDCISSSRN